MVWDSCLVCLVPFIEETFFSSFCVLSNLVKDCSHSVVSNSLQPQGLQHARLPYPSPFPGVCSKSCPLNLWCHPTISSSVPPSPSAFYLSQNPGSFSSELALPIRWPKYWSFSFSISPSNEYSGLIPFRTDWINPLGLILHCTSRDSQESSPVPQFENINTLVLSLLYGPTLTYFHWFMCLFYANITLSFFNYYSFVVEF